MDVRLAERPGVVTAGGVTLHHRDVGDPGGPPIVVLHGLMGHAHEWDALVQRLAGSHRVIVVDQRGHGRSDHAADYTPTTLAGDLEAVIEQAVGGPTAVVGHSMGGMAGLIAAARRPDLVHRLVLVDVGPDTVSDDLDAVLRETLDHLAAASYSTVDEAFAEWYAGGDGMTRPELLRHYLQHALVRRPEGRLAYGFDADGLTGFLDTVDEAELWRAVDEVRCPVLLLRGEQSDALTPATAAQMVRRFHDGRLAEIAGGAHDLGVQQPEAVAEQVLGFVG